MSSSFRGTTICAVQRNGQIAIAGDGQVTMGENTIFSSLIPFALIISYGSVIIQEG